MASRSTLRFSELLLFCFLVTLPTSAVGAGQTSSQLSHTERLYQEGMSLVEQRKLDEALQAFNRGLESDPSNRVLLNAIGATYTLKGDAEKAQDCFQKVLKIDPEFLPARKNLAMTYFNSGKYDLAGQEFDELASNPDAGPLAHLFLGMIAEKRKQYEAAVAQFKQAGNLVFQSGEAILSFARSLYERRQHEKSELILQRLAGVAGLSAVDYYEAGLLYSKCGRNDQALEALAKAREMNAELPGLEYQRALILDKMGRAAEALKILQGVMVQKPDRDSLQLLGEIAGRDGKLEAAAEAFRKVIEIEPDHEEAYLSLSTLLMDNENDPLGLTVVETGLAHLPQSYRLQVQKGAILEDLGRHQEAREIFRSAIRRQADHRDALIGLAVSQVYGGEIPESVETLASGVKQFPNDYYVHYFYGLALRKLAGLPRMDAKAVERKAAQALERSIHLNPAFADAYFLLGKFYVDNNPELAAKNFQTALRLNPRHDAAKYQLGRLYVGLGKREEGQKLLSQVNEQRAEMERRPKIILMGQ